MTPEQSRNLATAERYIALYNDDIERFVPACYSADVKVYAMGEGLIEGQAQFLEVERTVKCAAPGRRMRLDHLHLVEHGVVMEITLRNPAAGANWGLPFITVLSMRDGLIAIDRNYADWSRWPGLEALVGSGMSLPTPAPAVPPSFSHDDPLRQRNLLIAARYGALYNTDPERFVRECYHDDYAVDAMGIGAYEGIDKFIEVEKAVLAAAPTRRMRIDRAHATASAVVVEGVVVDAARGAEWALPFAAVLEMRDDKIAVDRTYANFKLWPGLDQVL